MTIPDTPAAVELIPPVQQSLWGPPAVLNFALGGLGAGFYIVAALAAGFGPAPALDLASWLGPALVLGGFVAVATEAGRPLRGPRVLTRVATSWMSRELWLGGAFVLLALGEFLVPGPAARSAAALAAAALATAQGFILRESRGVAAWNVPLMPPLFLLSALLGGAGGLMVVTVAGGRPPGGALLGSVLFALAFGVGAWLAYLTRSGDGAFTRATRDLREGRTAIALVGVGYVLPFALGAVALARPAAAPGATVLAGLAMIAGQVHAKAVIVLRAGQLRPITLAGLTLQRRPS